jgi:hypothetical protein
MTKFNAEREADIARAIEYLERTPGVKKSKVAIKFHVPYRLLKARLEGRNPQNAKEGYKKALDSDQDDALRQYINFLIYCGHQGSKIQVKLAANSILRASGSTRQLDLQWARRWF